MDRAIAVGAMLVSSPRRLLHHKGRWLLEVESMVAVDPNVLRPTLKVVHGESAIIDSLADGAAGHELVARAQELMQSVPAGDLASMAFVPGRDHWLPAPFHEPHDEEARPATPDRGHRGAAADPAAANRVARLSGALDRLEQALEGVRARVARLEKESRSAAGAGEVQALTARCEELERRLEGLEEMVASGRAAAPLPEVSGAAKSVAPEPDPQPTMATPPQEPAVPAPLRFPHADALNEVLRQLVGEGVNISETRKVRIGPPTAGWFCAMIVDDLERIRGAVVADIKATVTIGGQLMMLPPAEIVSQQRSKQPSEDVISAMSEVLNTLNSILNQVPDNPHVRSTYMEPLDLNALPWAATPSERLDLLEKGGGTLVFLARDPADVLKGEG